MVGKTLETICSAIWQEKHQKLYTVLSSLGVVFLMCIFSNCICLACIVVILCVFVVSYVYLLYLIYICCTLCVFVVLCAYRCFTLDAGLLARSQYPEGPATGHLYTGFSWFPLQANAEMVPKFSKLLLHASHVALPT